MATHYIYASLTLSVIRCRPHRDMPYSRVVALRNLCSCRVLRRWKLQLLTTRVARKNIGVGARMCRCDFIMLVTSFSQ